MNINVKVAQLVEHSPEERRVGGSSPPLDTKLKNTKRCFLIWNQTSEQTVLLACGRGSWMVLTQNQK